MVNRTGQYAYQVSRNGENWLWFVTKDSEVIASGQSGSHTAARTEALAFCINELDGQDVRYVA